MKKKIVLAYSGGLDTSVILKWLQTEYKAEVIAYAADLGQGAELKEAKLKAKKLGAKKIYVENLKEEITAILKSETKCQELVLRLESPGGTVIGYGLCAAQLQRLRDAGIKVTACVDKVAASGGYMMACVCNKIVSSPFAIIGSIGVVAAIPNFHKVLKKNDIDYELHTAGEYKRTITMFGETTPAGRKKFKEHLEDIHILFKDHIKKFRPSLNIKKIATGETWEGIKALEVGLVDEISTSDEYLLNLSKKHEIFEICYITKQNFQDRFSGFISETVTKLLVSLEPFFDQNKYR